MAVVPGSGWVAWRSIPGLSARGWFLLGSGWLFFARGWFLWLAVGTSRRVAWFGAVLVWGGLLVPGVVGLRAVGSLPVPRRGLIAGVLVILVWLLVGGWWLLVGGGARKLGVGWWCSPGWLLDGWLSPVRATVGCCFPAPMVGGVPGVVVGVRVLGWLFFGWWWLAPGCLMFPWCGLLLAGSGCWYFLARGSCWRLMVGRGSGVWWGGWHYPAWAGLQGWAHGCCSMFPGVLDSVAGWRGALRRGGGGRVIPVRVVVLAWARCVAF